MYRNGFHNHTNSLQQIIGTASATGVASGYLGPVPAGYCWYIERMTAHSTTAVTSGAVLEIFVLAEPSVPSNYTATSGSRAGRQDISLSPQNDVSDESSPIYVPEGYSVVAGWTGLTAGDKASVSFQIAVHQLNMEYGNTRRDVAALHSYYHEQDAEQMVAPPPHN